MTQFRFCRFPIVLEIRALLIALLLTGAALSPQQASAQSGRNCDAIKDDHAFNLCLASQGPRRGVRATPPADMSAAPRADGGPQARGTRRAGRNVRAGGARLRGGMVITRSKNGRVRMVIPGRRR